MIFSTFKTSKHGGYHCIIIEIHIDKLIYSRVYYSRGALKFYLLSAFVIYSIIVSSQESTLSQFSFRLKVLCSSLHLTEVFPLLPHSNALCSVLYSDCVFPLLDDNRTEEEKPKQFRAIFNCYLQFSFPFYYGH